MENDSLFSILLLEDEPADAYLVKLALEQAKLLVTLNHVNDGQEGLEFLEATQLGEKKRPDLILMDLNMPRLSGCEFLNIIKSQQQFQDIPVVVLTTSDAESDVLHSYQLGASSYITKPIDVASFMQAVDKLGEYWFTLVRLPQIHNI